MLTAQDYFDRAEHARINLGKPHSAIMYYQTAIRQTGCSAELLLACLHMLGVCYRMAGEPEMALEYYAMALKNAVFTPRVGSILRDMALCHIDLERFSEAEKCLDRAFEFLPRRESIEEYAMTLSFKARLELAKGDRAHALRLFETADIELHHGTNRHYYLYNLVTFASALSEDKQRLRSRKIAYEALWVARDLRDRKNMERSLILLAGGHHLENLLKYLRAKLR